MANLRATRIATAIVLLLAGRAPAGEGPFVQLTGWGGGKPEEVVPQAAEVGFDEIIVTRHDAGYLRQMIELGRRHQVGIYSCVHLSDLADWKRRRPDLPPPLQQISPEEEAARQRIEADKSPGKSNYQYGGEPFRKLEVLQSPLLCFHHPQVRPFFEEQIRELLQVDGLRGVALDFFGYQNYRCCRCATSQAAWAAWRKEHPALPADRALDAFSLESLVEFINALAGYARGVRGATLVTCHVYPVFLPEPLYGNRLDVDYCGQTAAWFFEPFWSVEKIRRYTQIIASEEKRHFARAEGVAMIGFYAQPQLYPVKSAQRLEDELHAILAGGGDRVQVCSLNAVLNDPGAREVFKRYFGRGRAGGAAPGLR